MCMILHPSWCHPPLRRTDSYAPKQATALLLRYIGHATIFIFEILCVLKFDQVLALQTNTLIPRQRGTKERWRSWLRGTYEIQSRLSKRPTRLVLLHNTCAVRLIHRTCVNRTNQTPRPS